MLALKHAQNGLVLSLCAKAYGRSNALLTSSESALVPTISQTRSMVTMENEAERLGIPPNAQNAEDVNLPINAAERKRVLNILAQRRYREYIKITRKCNLLILLRSPPARETERFGKHGF